MLKFEFDGCVTMMHNGVVHAIPAQEDTGHEMENCPCGTSELRLGNSLLAILHSPIEDQTLLDALGAAETPEEALSIRKEFLADAKAKLKEGALTKKEYFNRWAEFEGVYQNIFRTN